MSIVFDQYSMHVHIISATQIRGGYRFEGQKPGVQIDQLRNRYCGMSKNKYGEATYRYKGDGGGKKNAFDSIS